jgi:hypothetical protein
MNRAGVACADGDATRRGLRGRPQRIPDMDRASVGNGCAASPNRGAQAQRYASSVFRLSDRLFWLLFARWWPGWRDNLVIVQPATVLRWHRKGWSGLWRHRSRGRWRGGRPRISRELRRLIVRMARENFLWGAPRIHGELLMLGITVSQATVRATCLHEADGRSHRGGLFFAIKPWPSVTASIPRNGRVESLAHGASPIRPS